MTDRRFPLPWTVETIPGGLKVCDANGQALAYVYSRENESGTRLARVLTLDEARRIARNIANDAGKLDHVGFTSITNRERGALTERLEALIGPPGFTEKDPRDPTRWSTERTGDWEPVKPKLVVEVRHDHVSGDRFRHGTKLIRWRPDKRPQQCTFEQLGREARPAALIAKMLAP
jgi:ATP-dependent DNA ligase